MEQTLITHTMTKEEAATCLAACIRLAAILSSELGSYKNGVEAPENDMYWFTRDSVFAIHYHYGLHWGDVIKLYEKEMRWLELEDVVRLARPVWHKVSSPHFNELAARRALIMFFLDMNYKNRYTLHKLKFHIK